MINLNTYIAPQGSNLRGDIWVLAGPWVQVAKQCTINFPDTFGTNVIIAIADFSYLGHSGSIKLTLNLRDANTCSINISGTVDNSPVNLGESGVPYTTVGNKLIISWSKFPLAFYRYHGGNETEIDVANVPAIGNLSFWIGK
jgi:hypothetical protein